MIDRWISEEVYTDSFADTVSPCEKCCVVGIDLE